MTHTRVKIHELAIAFRLLPFRGSLFPLPYIYIAEGD